MIQQLIEVILVEQSRMVFSYTPYTSIEQLFAQVHPIIPI